MATKKTTRKNPLSETDKRKRKEKSNRIPKRLQDGYFHEAQDRIHCLQINIEHTLLMHPAILSNDKWQKEILSAMAIFGNVYQEIGRATP